MPITLIRVFRYRLSPTRAQEATLAWTCDRLRELYNAALQERRDGYRRGLKITCYGQQAELPEMKALRPEYADIHAQVLRDPIVRLDKSFSAFFARCKRGDKPGYPRFKGRGQYNSFTYPQASAPGGGGAKLLCGGKRVRLHGIGEVRIRMHRPLQGKVKTATITKDGDGHWYICFACEVEAKPLPATGADIGVDVGLKSFLATSDGEMVDNPRPLATAAASVKRAQRVVSKRKRGSHRRRKAVALLAKEHAHVARVRRDFHHKTARALVNAYDLIAVEDLNVKGLARGMLAKAVNDVGWCDFMLILASKAESAGREVVKVPPAHTSQDCSACGTRVPKTLADRVHRCPSCGLTMDRDVNAAINILRLGRSLRRGAAVVMAPQRPEKPTPIAAG